MEDSLYHLQLDYLLLAREMVLSGQEEQAKFSLGLTPEAMGILKKLQVQQIREIARRECLAFTPRFNASFWGRYLQVDQSAHEGDACDSQARDLLMLLTGSGDIA